MSPMNGLTLVSFDVDGTLIESVGAHANKLHKDAFSHGFKKVFGIDTHIDVIKHHGSTDPLIILKVLEHHGIARQEAEAKLLEVQEVMNDHFVSNAADAGEGIRILPGVKELLARLKAHSSVASCLVTGNLEPIGWTKMKALGISDLFTEPLFGGFGSDHCGGNTDEPWHDRAEFINIAARKHTGTLPEGSPGITARYHVGDTPNDIQAAVEAGAVPIAVATGIFTKEQLAAVAPGKVVVMEDGLRDVDAFLRVIGLSA